MLCEKLIKEKGKNIYKKEEYQTKLMLLNRQKITIGNNQQLSSLVNINETIKNQFFIHSVIKFKAKFTIIQKRSKLISVPHIKKLNLRY